MFELARLLGVRGIVVLVVLAALGTWARTHFFHYIDASAELGVATFLTGTYYDAHVNAHAGHPVDLTCLVTAVDKEGNVAGKATFTVTNLDGKQDHSGQLNVLRETDVKEKLTVDCEET